MVKEVQNMEIRSYGRYIFLEAILILNKDVALSKIDSLKKSLSSAIKDKFPQIFKIILITQTQEEVISTIAIPVEEDKGVDSKVFEHYGEAPYFAILKMKEGEFLNLEIFPNKFMDREKRKGILISDWLSTKKIDKLYVQKELKKGPELVFDQGLIKVMVSDLETVEQIIDHEKKIFSAQ
ncbi:MAG: hypothetical protein EU542_06280 [Promethearchaeota archaeon]|nr:MAG: hypothetical protein EU542_06280 [Candidatus Lokiarchaeota archaeon]